MGQFAGHIVQGLGALASPETVLLTIIGMFVGMFVGILPGLGVVLVLSLMLPFVYHLGVVPGIAIMLATLSGGFFSASITAILLNTPGAPESFPTTFDGFPMSQKGEAGRALAISATSTLLGGWIAAVAFIGLFQLAGPLTSLFLPPDYVTVIILALVLIGESGNVSVAKAVISGGIGFMLSFIGSDPVTGIERFTFGIAGLFSGIPIVPFALGVFAITQMVVMYGENKSVTQLSSGDLSSQFRNQIPQGIKDVIRNWMDVVRSSVVAVILGLVPGIGAISANFISYGIGQRTSRRRHLFGTGIPEGVISAEASSLSKEVGSLIPAIALGLPSGTGMVLFLAALSILGVQPGPTLFKTTPNLPYTMMWLIVIAGTISCIVGLVLAPWLAKITGVRGPLLLPFILALAVIGTYAYQANTLDVAQLMIFSGAGLVMRKLHFSLPAIIMGIILGGTFDDNLHLTEVIYRWNFLKTNPLADILIIITIIAIISGFRRQSVHRKTTVMANPEKNDVAEKDHSKGLLEPITYGVLIALCALYFIVALGYPTSAGQVPAVVAALVGLISIYEFVRTFNTGHLNRRQQVGMDTEKIVSSATPALQGPSDISNSENLLEGQASPIQVVTDAEKPLVVFESSSSSSNLSKGTDESHRGFREIIGLGWVVLYGVSFYVLGAVWGIPVATAIYCALGSRLSNLRQTVIFGVVATATAFVLAYGFVQLFHLSYGGII